MTTLDALRRKNFATVAEVRDVVFGGEVDERTIRRAIEDGTLPAVKLGTKTLIPVPRLLALIEPAAQSTAALPSPGISPDAVQAAAELIRAGLAALRSLTESPGETGSATVTRLPGLDGVHATAG